MIIPLLSECPKSELYKKPSLAGLPLTCSISSKCTEIHCCLQVKPIGRNFEVYIDLDPCNKTLFVGIEEYRTKVNLLTYIFGKCIDIYCHLNNMAMILSEVLMFKILNRKYSVKNVIF